MTDEERKAIIAHARRCGIPVPGEQTEDEADPDSLLDKATEILNKVAQVVSLIQANPAQAERGIMAFLAMSEQIYAVVREANERKASKT